MCLRNVTTLRSTGLDTSDLSAICYLTDTLALRGFTRCLQVARDGPLFAGLFADCLLGFVCFDYVSHEPSRLPCLTLNG